MPQWRSSIRALLTAAVRRAGSAVNRVVAPRPPAKNQVVLLSASRRLTRSSIMGMEMSSAIGDGVVHSYMPFKPLMQISGLRDVDRTPTPILILPGIDVKAGQRSEGSVERIHLVLILLPRLARPVDER